jgi:glutamate-1-semialdehyde aminotransferase
LEFEGETEEESSLMRMFLVREAAARGVLFHHGGGLSFVCYSHSDADVDVTVAVQRELFAEIENLRRAGTLAEACGAVTAS